MKKKNYLMFLSLAISFFLLSSGFGLSLAETNEESYDVEEKNDPFPLIKRESVTEEGWENVNIVGCPEDNYIAIKSSHDYKVYIADMDTLEVVSNVTLDGWISDIVHHPTEPVLLVTSSWGGEEQYLHIVEVDEDLNAVHVESIIYDENPRTGQRTDNVAVNPNGSMAYVIQRSGHAYKVCLSTFGSARISEVSIGGGSFNNIEVHPHGTYLYGQTSLTQDVYIYDIHNDYELVTHLDATSTPIFDSTGNRMVLTYYSHVRMLDTTDHSVITYFEGDMDYSTPVSFEQDDEIIMTLAYNELSVYGTQSGSVLERSVLEDVYYTTPRSPFISHDGERLYAVIRDEVLIYDVSYEFTDDAPSRYPERLDEVSRIPVDTFGHYEILPMKSHDSLIILEADRADVGDQKGRIRKVSVTGEEVINLTSDSLPRMFQDYSTRTMSPSGEELVLVSSSNITTLNIETGGIEVFEIDTEIESFSDTVYHKDGTLILSGRIRETTDQGTFILTGMVMGFDFNTGEIDWEIELSLRSPSVMAINPDSTILLVGSDIGDSTTIIDLVERKIIHSVPVRRVNSMSVSDDGSLAYLAAERLFVVNLEDFTYHNHRVGTGRKYYQDICGDARTIALANEGDNNIVLIDTQRHNVFALGHVGSQPLETILLPELDAVVTFDEEIEEFIVFRTIDAPEYEPAFIPGDYEIYLFPQSGDAPLEISDIRVKATNFGDEEGSVPVTLDGVEIFNIDIEPYSESQDYFNYTFAGGGEFEVRFGDVIIPVSVTGDPVDDEDEDPIDDEDEDPIDDEDPVDDEDDEDEDDEGIPGFTILSLVFAIIISKLIYNKKE